jgi:hypothetical protein
VTTAILRRAVLVLAPWEQQRSEILLIKYFKMQYPNGLINLV